MKIDCPGCTHEIDLQVSTENILFFVQKCPYCKHEHTAVLKNFRCVDGEIVGELQNVGSEPGHFDIRREDHGEKENDEQKKK